VKTKETANKTKDAIQTTDSIETVRELLFGEQVRSIDKHIDTATINLDRKIVELREELQVHLAAYEKAYQNAHHALERQSNNENESLKTAIAELQSDQGSSTTKLNDRLDQLEHALAEEAHGLRKSLEQRMDDLDTLQSHQNHQLTKTVNELAAQVEKEKVSRDLLADLFVDIADKLRNA